MCFDTREEVVDLGLDLGEEGGLGVGQVVLRDELEVLEILLLCCRTRIPGRISYFRGLKDFSKPRIVAHARVEDVDARIEQPHARAQGRHAALERIVRVAVHPCLIVCLYNHLASTTRQSNRRRAWRK